MHLIFYSLKACRNCLQHYSVFVNKDLMWHCNQSLNDTITENDSFHVTIALHFVFAFNSLLELSLGQRTCLFSPSSSRLTIQYSSAFTSQDSKHTESSYACGHIRKDIAWQATFFRHTGLWLAYSVRPVSIIEATRQTRLYCLWPVSQ